MKRYTLIAVVLLSGCNEPPLSDAEQLPGEWIVVDFRSPMATEDRGQRRKHARISEETWSEQFQGETFEDFEYTIDCSKSPKQLDLKYTTCDGKRLTVRAIYELTGPDRLRVCLGSPPLAERNGKVEIVESVRPTEFAPKDGAVIVYRRKLAE